MAKFATKEGDMGDIVERLVEINKRLVELIEELVKNIKELEKMFDRLVLYICIGTIIFL